MAAIANASFALPMKWMRQWSWENSWLLWSIGSLLVLPILVACLSVPDLFNGYQQVALGVMARVILFGFAWGIAQVLFGLSVDKIGMALTFSIVLGTSAAIGTIVPFIRLHADLLLSSVGSFVIAGIASVTCGMIFCARAGFKRELEAAGDTKLAQGVSFRGGLTLAFVSGLCASFMNVGISFALPIATMAAQHGARPYWTLNAVWPPLLFGGFIPNVSYCTYLLVKHRSGVNFYQRGTQLNWALCALMSILWFGSSLAYGVSSFYLGEFGPIIGWPIFMSLIVICASILGWMSGEWRTTTRRPLQLHIAGIGMLILALFFLSRVSA